MSDSHIISVRVVRGDKRSRCTLPLPNFAPNAAKRKMHEVARRFRGAGWGGVIAVYNARGKRIGWRSFRPAVAT